MFTDLPRQREQREATQLHVSPTRSGSTALLRVAKRHAPEEGAASLHLLRQILTALGFVFWLQVQACKS